MALIKQESGSKVGWEYYDNKAEAVARGEAIRAPGGLRDIAVENGYDFGYQSPGEVRQSYTYPKNADGSTDWKSPQPQDVWIVTVP